MNIHFFFRKPTHFFSIEELFKEIQKQINKQGIKTFGVIAPLHNKGIINRIRIIIHALKNKGDINHITGDIHFLGIFLPRKNTVLTIHDCGALHNLKGIQKRILWFFWFYLPVKRLKYITTVSQETKNQLLGFVNVNPDKIRIIHNCLIDEYKVSKRLFDTRNPRILQIGVTKNKNLSRILSALKSIRCTLIILGKPDASDLSLLKNSGVLFELHYDLSRREVQNLYGSCDFLLFPSLLEGFGLPIIEAQASGIPVLTSNISSMPEISGDAACMVNPYEIEEIRNGVLKIINNKSYREQLVVNGLKNCKRFSPEHIAGKYIELYKNIEAVV